MNCQVHAAAEQQQADKDNQCGKGGQLSITGNCLTAIKLLIPIPLESTLLHEDRNKLGITYYQVETNIICS